MVCLLKDDFDETFGGMETALVEVQRRGKAMMNTVQIHLLLLKTTFESLANNGHNCSSDL